MHIRFKITLFFTLIIFLLLSLLCSFIYYFSYNNRKENIKTQLTKLALSTSYMLRQPGTYDHWLMKKIDSNTILTVKHKMVLVYDSLDLPVYNYNEPVTDLANIDRRFLNDARLKGMVYFNTMGKDGIAYYDKNGQKVIVAAAIDEQGNANLKRLRIILILSLGGGIFIALASGYFFSKVLLRPVKKIADEVNTISAQSLTHRVRIRNTKDEWNYLAETLNDLLNRLQESFEVQRRFISSASHELSTPLTSISSQLEVSLQRDRSAADYRQVMQSVYQDVLHLNKLTQTLLEFASVSGNAGGIELNLVRIDEVLMRLPGEMTKIDKEYSVKLEFEDLPENETNLLVFGNAELLFTAIKNIVSNACKYSLSRLAKVKLSIEQPDILITVEDNGKGISESELQNIFQPFYRTEDSRSVIGFGVGLPLVNRIVKLHKGNIRVKSVVGKGTSFIIQLPIAGRYQK